MATEAPSTAAARCEWCGNANPEQLRTTRYGVGYICRDGDACIRRRLGKEDR